MKKVFFFCFLSLFVLGTFFAAPKKSKSIQLEPIEFDLVKLHKNNFDYIVDPRVELMAIVCRMAKCDLFNYDYNGDNLYLTQIDTLFSKYSDEFVVKSVKNFVERGITNDAFISLAYHINPDFSGTIIPLKPFPDTLDKRWEKIGPNTINGFVKALHDFAVKSNFARIYMINRSDYLSNVNWLGDSLEKKNVEPWARKFFKGIYIGDTTFVTSRVTVCYNFYDTVQDFYRWKYSYITTYPGTYWANLISAYFSLYMQSYANDEWDNIKENFTKYIKAVNKILYQDKTEKEIEKMEITPVDFTIFTSLFIYISYLEDNIESAPEDDSFYKPNYDSLYATMEKMLDKGFVGFMECFREYKQNRDKYPEFRDFYPKLTEYVNSLSLE